MGIRENEPLVLQIRLLLFLQIHLRIFSLSRLPDLIPVSNRSDKSWVLLNFPYPVPCTQPAEDVIRVCSGRARSLYDVGVDQRYRLWQEARGASTNRWGALQHVEWEEHY